MRQQLSLLLCLFVAVVLVQGHAIVGPFNKAVSALSISDGAQITLKHFVSDEGVHVVFICSKYSAKFLLELPDTQDWVIDAQGCIHSYVTIE